MSPHGRGGGLDGRGFPRVSGDEPWEVLEADFQLSFPRVSGDEPAAGKLARPPRGFSPRERG